MSWTRLAVRVLPALVPALLAVQARAADADQLMRDLLRTHSSPTSHEFAYWLPAGAFAVLSPGMSPAASKSISDRLAGYQLFLVEHAVSDQAGHVATVQDDSDVIRLRLADGRLLSPELPDALPPHALAMATSMKAIVDRQGASAKGLRIVFFKLPDTIEEPRFDAPHPSLLTLQVGAVSMVWHLPLAGTGPSAVDPDSGERFPGGYAFNPYTGVALKHE